MISIKHLLKKFFFFAFNSTESCLMYVVTSIFQLLSKYDKYQLNEMIDKVQPPQSKLTQVSPIFHNL